MEVNSATQTQAAAQAQAAASSDKSVLSSDFDTFLKMLTAQVQNQDPLNPMDSADFSTQLATFSGVEQQVKTNDLLTALGTQMGIMGMAQLASWIGLEARAATPTQFDGAPISISPNPAVGSDRAVLVVRDHNGTEVQRYDISPTTDEIQWAGVSDGGGPFANGQYSFEVESYSGDELLSIDKTEVYTEIIEAKSHNGDTVLVLYGGAEISSSGISGLRGAG